jgi:hypothetical protein
MTQHKARDIRPSGHLQVTGSREQRTWYALWRDADGRHKKGLGPAHVKDSGRRTPRGAVMWRAADGPKPDRTYLSPADARSGRLIRRPATTRRRSGSNGMAQMLASCHSTPLDQVRPAARRR